MRSRILLCASILFYALLFASLPVALAANFSDVLETHKNAYAIQTLKDAGVVAGYGDGTFQPDKTVSRAEASAIIMKAAGLSFEKTAQKIPFTDVAEDAWYFPVIQKGVAMGKLKGYEDLTFRPNNPVNLPEALALALSFFQVDIKKIEADAVIYGGFDSKQWYAPHAQYAKNKNLIEPDASGHIDPAAAIKRGELAEIIYRMRASRDTGKPFDVTSSWVATEYPENFWRLRHPPDWEIFKGLKNTVFWKRVPLQIFFTRLWPMGVRLSVSVAENPGQFSSFKEEYKKQYSGVSINFSDVTMGNRPALKIAIPERRILDAIVQLPNGNFLVMYGEYGEAAIGEWHKKQLELAMNSYQYAEKPPEPPKPVIPLEERMETLRENILVKGKWAEVAPNFPDKKLIQTDAIGIGTGPVDYYYSKEANHTIKLERNSATILNIREGEITAF